MRVAFGVLVWVYLGGCSTADSRGVDTVGVGPGGDGTATAGTSVGSGDHGTTTQGEECPSGSVGCPCSLGTFCVPGAICVGDVCELDPGSSTTAGATGIVSDSSSGSETGSQTATSGGHVDIVCGDGIPAPREICWQSPMDLVMGTAPYDVGIANFDGDPGLDIVTVDRSSSTLSLRIGSGTGEFGVRSSMTIPATPTALAIGDFDGDGVFDVVSGSTSTNQVSLHQGDADGAFTTTVSAAAMGQLNTLRTAHFGDPQRDDLVAVGTGAAAIGVFSTDPAPFVAMVSYPANASPRGLALAQINDDQWPDAMVVNPGAGTISLLLGNAEGEFGAPAGFSVGASPRAVAAGDVNGDGFGDVIVTLGGGQIVRLLGNGLGLFGAAFPFGTASDAQRILMLDVDHDEDLDLIVASTGDNTVRVMVNDGSGNFVEQASIPAGNAPLGLAAGDLNGDGAVDIVAANSTGTTVTVILSDA